MTELLFNICNITILVVWTAILFFPRTSFSKLLISFPWIPLGISFLYIYFIIIAGGLADADFSSLDGIVSLFKKATPESAAAGWLHYLAFDFWMGAWILKNSKKILIPHIFIILPLLFTFMLGPVGVLTYVIISKVYLLKNK